MQSRARETRDALAAAAGKVFSESGYANAALTEICRAAGTTSGALYFHFDSKESLAKAVLQGFDGEMRAFCDALLRRDGTPLETMVFASLAWGRRIVADPIVAGGVRLSIERPDLLNASVDAYDPWVVTTLTLLSRARDEGEVSPATAVEPATRFLLGSFVGAQIMSREFTGHQDFEHRLIDLWRYALIGLLPRRSPTKVDDLIARALDELESPPKSPRRFAPAEGP